MDIKTPLRTRIRISETNGWAAGMEGIYLGYNAQYDSVKVGFVDEDGNYTGEDTRVPRRAASIVEDISQTVAAENPENPPRRPGTAVARVLSGLGLKQGRDFRVTGKRNAAGERLYTYLTTFTRAAEETIAENADAIESATVALDFPFVVSIRYLGDSDRPTVSVHNSPGRLRRVREERPVPSPNVTVTLPSAFVSRVLDQLRAVRRDDAVRDATPDVHVLINRLDDVLWRLEEKPAPGESREEWKTRTHGEHYGMGWPL